MFEVDDVVEFVVIVIEFPYFDVVVVDSRGGGSTSTSTSSSTSSSSFVFQQGVNVNVPNVAIARRRDARIKLRWIAIQVKYRDQGHDIA